MLFISPLPRLANSPLSRLVNLLVNSSLPEPVNLASPSEDFFARIPSPVLTQSLNLQKLLGKSWMEEMFSFHSAHLLRTRLNCRNSLRAVLSLLSKDSKCAQMEPIFTNMLKTRLSWGCRNYIILFGDLQKTITAWLQHFSCEPIFVEPVELYLLWLKDRSIRCCMNWALVGIRFGIC